MNKQLTLFTLLIVGLVVIGGCSKEKPASDNVVEAGGTKDRACSECEHLENHSCVAYKCCSDSDCSDGNQETEDTCINPSTLTSECEHKAIIKTCEDGTVYGECSGSKPSYCDNGNLLNNCNLCGCPTDRSTCLTNGDCSRFSENVDCENKDYKMAFILLVRSSEDANQDVLNQLSAIKNEFPVYFSEATAHKTQMDVASDTYIMYAKDSMLYANNVIPSEVTKEFYKEHNDVYDFLSIYTTFQSEQSSSHSLVVQNIQGIGSPLWDYSNTYGSKGKLKGVNFLRSVSQNFLIDDTSDLTIAMNILLHETGHQWCCYIGDNFGEGQRLEIKQQGIHFYRGLQSPY